ncbi:putative exopolysaccharide biosynthesis protein [Oryzomicrobium terrae]|uniref:Putative exopolysaccharide biosynthesis protein n=1 Tax=Oryzomicrobium terrae TaxID=1735038 RepID=A0A5C1E938_9RHOO|nr:chain length determinant protein EpsF [Oryzomicrobium terrae]QEL65393.1 putative exopolysaccharide biosynthesis protein [Oryzomicrobium terrae]
MNFHQLILVLRARLRLVMLTLAVTMLGTLVISLILPKEYTAGTSVVLDVKSPDPIVGMVLPALITPGYMATQVDIVNSDRVAERVVRLLRLDESPAVRQQWLDETDGKGQLSTWLVQVLQKKLDVKPSRDSNVLNIAYSAIDPGFAATVANAYAQAYIDINLELKVEPARQYALWFEKQNKVLREQMEKAQKALSEYQQRSGIVAADERLDYETNKLNELSTQLSMAQNQTADLMTRQRTGSASDTLNEVVQSPLINGLKIDLARLESKLKDTAVNLGTNHPQYQRQESEIAELKQRIDAESRHIANSVGSSGKASRLKEGEIVAAMEAQKKRVLELRRQRDELSVLQKDLESAQKSYDAVSMRLTQSKLESQSIQTNISVLTPATEPLQPSRPKIVLNLILAAFAGLLLGVCLALTKEVRQRRVRSADDLVVAVDAPLIGVLANAAPRISRWRRLARLPGRRNGRLIDASASGFKPAGF